MYHKLEESKHFGHYANQDMQDEKINQKIFNHSSEHGPRSPTKLLKSQEYRLWEQHGKC